MNPAQKYQAALNEALEIADSYYRGAEIHENRFLYAFDARNIFVVGDKNISKLGMAILIIEQIAILEAQSTYAMATAMPDLKNFTGVLQ
jgi:hypothetical protein